MVVFSIGAQVLDTLLIKGTVLAAETILSVATWSGKKVVQLYWPATVELTTEQKLLKEVAELRSKVEHLEHIEHIEHTECPYNPDFLVITKT